MSKIDPTVLNSSILKEMRDKGLKRPISTSTTALINKIEDESDEISRRDR
jgi:hypothetical protein